MTDMTPREAVEVLREIRRRIRGYMDAEYLAMDDSGKVGVGQAFDEALSALADRAGEAVALISSERQRQIESEGWTPEHDDEHTDGSLAVAAACYAVPASERMTSRSGVPVSWPWIAEWWKPGDRIRELTKAGALIAAEIDRLQRAAAPGASHE